MAKKQPESQPEKKPWYADGLKFECTQCGNCCGGPEAGYVWVTQTEILSLASTLGMADQLEEFENKFTRRVGRQTSLVEYSDGDCIFLDAKSRTCTVYESRPVQCRTWPFWKSNVDTHEHGAKRPRIVQVAIKADFTASSKSTATWQKAHRTLRYTRSDIKIWQNDGGRTMGSPSFCQIIFRLPVRFFRTECFVFAPYLLLATDGLERSRSMAICGQFEL